MRKISLLDISLLTRRLANLTRGGMTLDRSLQTLQKQTANRFIATVLTLLKREIQGGKSLSEALSLHKTIFSPVYIGMIRAGESSGSLDSALEELAQLLETDVHAREKIRAAFAYPLFLLSLAMAVTLFLTLFVIPRFEFLFEDLGQRLPLPTRVLIGFSVLIKRQIGIFILAVGAAVFLSINKRQQWIAKFLTLLLHFDWSREIIQGIYLDRWARVMSSLIKSGFTVTEALQLSRHTFGNKFYSDEVGAALRRVMEGRGLAESLSGSLLFPAMVCELVSVGEEASQLDHTFAQISQAYHREMERKMKLALSLLEPALILSMGVVVGFVAMGMLLPIFEMSASFK